jgi:hypothetical protein
LVEPELDDGRKDMVDVGKVQIDRRGGNTDMAGEAAQGWLLQGVGFDHLDRGGDEILAKLAPIPASIRLTPGACPLALVRWSVHEPAETPTRDGPMVT